VYVTIAAFVVMAVGAGGAVVLRSNHDTTKATASESMPDLLSRPTDEQRAKRILSDRGVTDVDFEEREDASHEPGTVIDQSPEPGERLSGAVVITLAKLPTTTPDWTGRPIAEVRDEANLLGVELDERTEVDWTGSSTAPGTVNRQDPPTGAAFAAKVTVFVSAASEVVDLGTLTSVGGASSSSRTATVGGKQVSGPTARLSLCSSFTSLTYRLDGRYGRLRGVLAVDDASEPGFALVAEIRLDSALASSPAQVRVGSSADIGEINVEGVSVLTIGLAPDPPTGSASCDAGTFVFADAKVARDPGSTTIGTSRSGRTTGTSP
jgi:hypothetical protein